MGHLVEDEAGQRRMAPPEHGGKNRVPQPPKRAVGTDLLDEGIQAFPFERPFLSKRILLSKETLVGHLTDDGKTPGSKCEAVFLAGGDGIEDRTLRLEIGGVTFCLFQAQRLLTILFHFLDKTDLLLHR